MHCFHLSPCFVSLSPSLSPPRLKPPALPMLTPVATLRRGAIFAPCRAEWPLSLPRTLLLDFHLHTINKGFDQLRTRCTKTSSFPIRAVSVDSNELGSSEFTHEENPKRYHFVVANAKFMLDEEEHFKELLFERLRNYGERSKEPDFWLVIEPKFLDRFPVITERLKRPAVALVSTDDHWITFMKLRLDRVLSGNYEADTIEQALDSNEIDLQFERPEKWVAPYSKYEFGWWESFLPPVSSKSEP